MAPSVESAPAGSGGTVLAIRLRQLGDILATLGVLAALKASAQARRIIFVADHHYHELLRPLDYIDQLLPQPPAVHTWADLGQLYHYLETLRGFQADWVLDFHGNPRSAIMTVWTGAPVRLGFDVRVRKLAYTGVEPRLVFDRGRPAPRNSQAAAFALARRMGLREPVPARLASLEPDEAAIAAGLDSLLGLGIERRMIRAGKVIGINPGPPGLSKSWPEEHFVELAGRLIRKGRAVVFTWGPGEETTTRAIKDRCGQGAYLAPDLPLAGLPGFLKQLGCLVTVDSGLKHLAAAVRVPTVTLFGPTDPAEWHIGGPEDRYLYRNMDCSPCRLSACPIGRPCMTDITPEHVLAELIRLEARCEAG